MSRKSIGEKRQSFSMRKLSVGLVSVTVASFFLMSQGIQSVSADNMESPIHYKYMTEGELTDEEKSLLVEALLQLAEESDDTYYLGYIKTKKQDNAGISRTVDGKYSARSDSQPDSTKISDVVHSADSEWSQGQGKVS